MFLVKFEKGSQLNQLNVGE